MKTSFLLGTNGDALGVVRQFLQELWSYADLDGMLVPIYHADGINVSPYFVEDPSHLMLADPLAPMVSASSAKMVPQITDFNPKARLGFVWHSCEARAWQWLIEQKNIAPGNWLIIGVDCLSSFSSKDFGWRVERAGNVERLTRETMRFARMGGIAPYRYRDACQMCTSPVVQDADLNIELLGLPVKSVLIITAKDREIVNKLRLRELTDGEAPPSLVSRREATLGVLSGRRRQAAERMEQGLSEDMPAEVGSLLQYFANCAPCQECLEACPIYMGEFSPATNGGAKAISAATRWLESCISCGMCDDACPKQMPLTAMFRHIHHALQDDINLTPASNLAGFAS